MDKPDFAELVEAHGRELHAYLWRMLGDEAEAQDCLQDTFLRALRAYPQVEDASFLRAWLYKIATNTAYSRLARAARLAAREVELREPLAAGGLGVEAAVAQRHQLAQLRRAVRSLPARQQAALMLRKYQELDYAEVAAALGCNQAAARANVYQALKKLRQWFKENE
ncbi:MAG: RNA polymerase sigma factor [Anaerolineales bacterium]|nr:RNA polymerase sigma factor [Anaerolineales bacterium]